MWGDPQRAFRLDPSDKLAALLFQITGPAHVPWNDPRWQELFHGYNVWVHLEAGHETVVVPACASMAKHASTSSNLAALALHVARMVRELTKATLVSQKKSHDLDLDDNVSSAFTQRIALVGKARATAGALRLMRILLHGVVVKCSSLQDEQETLQQVLTYRSRNVVVDMDHDSRERNASVELLSSLLSFLSHMGDNATTENNGGENALSQLTSIPELHDATVLALELLLVCLSSQLYQPMVSSMQRQEESISETPNFALDQIMAEAWKRQEEQRKRQFRQQEAFSMNNDSREEDEHDETIESQPFLNPTTTRPEHLDWSPQSVLKACVTWLIQRPPSPVRSIAHHNSELAKAVVQARGEKVGQDGMYESHVIVMAARHESHAKSMLLQDGNHSDGIVSHDQHHHVTAVAHHQSGTMRPPSQLILDATKGVLVLSSTLILLPFRLMSLALGLWGYRGLRVSTFGDSSGYDQTRMMQLRSSAGGSRRTNDVLWLSDSPVADLGCTLFLLLTNNHRAPKYPDHSKGDPEGNPFRSELRSFNDNRWEGSEGFGDTSYSPDPLGHAAQNDDGLDLNAELDPFVKESNNNIPRLDQSTPKFSKRQLLTANFESLFEAFGNIVHTEVGALVLYTVLQSSPIFSASVSVRSDLDTLVLPLLRTLYFASAQGHWSQKDGASIKSPVHHDGTASTQSGQKSFCPFRSQSQLYVILILLLLFSQDASFGTDAFRRVTVSNVVWYKERNLKEINFGSVLLLVLLRSISFNLNRLKDAFLLSNCCAVLMNLSPNICNIHEYAAMRLASVTMSVLKRYAALVAKNGGKVSRNEDITTNVGMYGEVSRTLLRLLRHCVGPKNIDKNLHLVYSLVYHQTEFNNIVSKKDCPFTPAQLGRIQTVISEANLAIQEDGDARTAPKALNVLKNSMSRFKQAVQRKPEERSSSLDSVALVEQDGGGAAEGDFTFTYEEEADPEIFFIPYIWEVIVCVVTVSSVEWDKNHIQVFPLLEEEEQPQDMMEQQQGNGEPQIKGYSDDVSNVV